MSECIFCEIVAKGSSAEILFESDNIIAIPDINPSADVHLLIIPKKHIPTFMDINKSHNDLILEMFSVTRKLIKTKKIQGKYRISLNGGKLQYVAHLHMHLLGGNLKKWAHQQ